MNETYLTSVSYKLRTTVIEEALQRKVGKHVCTPKQPRLTCEYNISTYKHY